MQISDLAGWLRGIETPGLAPLVAGLQQTLDSFVSIGLGYLSLDRPSGTLSGGEAQRVKMVRHLGSALTDVTYVFDEPSIGLHAHDVERMNHLLAGLRDKGNTVLVVEHDPEVIRIADHVVDMGPGRRAGGRTHRVRGSGRRARRGRHRHRAASRRAPGAEAGAADADGLDPDPERPAPQPPGRLGRRAAGRAGRGDRGCRLRARARSSTAACRGPSPSVTFIDQSAIRGSRRSNPATYTGILDPIRKAFATACKVPASLFSANSEGACPACNGLGMIYTDLGFMAEIASVCETCEGRRFSDEVLEHRLRERNIVEVLAMSVEEARAFFTEKRVRVMLDRLAGVGLGYISLGQELQTLSGGERQRLKLAIEMGGDTEVYVLDEPTTGLHMQDVDNLVGDAGPAGGLRADRDRHRAQPRRGRAGGLGDRPGAGRRPRRRAGDVRGDAGATWSAPRARSPGSSCAVASWTRRREGPRRGHRPGAARTGPGVPVPLAARTAARRSCARAAG